MVFIHFESRCLKWQNWEQRQHYVKCGDRGMPGHGEMCCLTGSAEAQWVQNQNEELQCWDRKQRWLCLCYRNLPAGPKTACAYCPEMLLQIKWYATNAKIRKAAKASDLCQVPPVQLPCTGRPSMHPPAETPMKHLWLKPACLLLPSQLVFFLLPGEKAGMKKQLRAQKPLWCTQFQNRKKQELYAAEISSIKGYHLVSTKSPFSISLPCRGWPVDNCTTIK